MNACLRRRPRPGNRIVPLTLAAALAAAAGVAPAAAQTVYTGSIEAATGQYIFAERTTGVYILNGVEVSAGRVYVSATVPFITQSTPWITYSPALLPTGGAQSAQVADEIRRGQGRGATDGRSLVVTLPTATAARRTAFGDPVFRAGADLMDARSPTRVRVGAALKAPLTDSADGFGTGAWDYGAAVAVSHQQGVHDVFASFEIWRFGDLPDLAIKDAASYRVGYERFVGTNRWSVLGAVSGWTTVLDGVDPPVSVEVGLTRHLGEFGRSVGLTASFGITDMAPDLSVALGWRLPF